MAQELRALAAIPEDTGSILSTPTVATNVWNSSSKGFDIPLQGFWGTRNTCDETTTHIK